jgi:hypothetical protein
MNPQTLKALRGSIKKWEDICSGVGVDNGADNCPLCTRFYSRQCSGCPVMLKTGFDSCNGTPYAEKWYYVVECDEKGKILCPAVANTPERLSAARAELRFLKSLLP